MKTFSDKVEINLIINEKSVNIQMNLSKITSEVIDDLCNDLAMKYSLDNHIKNRLAIRINNELKEVEKRGMRKNQDDLEDSNGIFHHLYYDGIRKRQERKEYIEKVNWDKKRIEDKKCPFTPSINHQSSRLYKRDYKRIEDKLYYREKAVSCRSRNNLKKKKGLSDIILNEKDSYNTKGKECDHESCIDEKVSRKQETVFIGHNSKLNEEHKEKPIEKPTTINLTETTLKHVKKNKINNNDQQSSKMQRNRNHLMISHQDSYVKKFIDQQNSIHKTNSHLQNNIIENQHELSKQYDMNKQDIIKPPIRKHTSPLHFNKVDDTYLLAIPLQKSLTILISNRSSQENILHSKGNNTFNKDHPLNTSESHLSKKNNNIICTVDNNNRHIKYNQSHNSNHTYWAHRKYLSKSSMTIRKENEINQLYDSKYTFEPIISKHSSEIVSRKRKESKDMLYKRLSQSKQTQSARRALMKLNSIVITDSDLLTNSKTFNHTTTINCKTNNQGTISNTAISNKKKSRNDDDNNSLMNNNPPYYKRDKQKSMELLFYHIHKEKSQTINNKSFKSNYDKFKQNQLREIYDLLVITTDQIDISMIPNTIPYHLREGVIIPTCMMIKQNNLKFNYHNFQLIAMEILEAIFHKA